MLLAYVAGTGAQFHRPFAMSKAQSNKLAGQVGEYLVCAELGRRGMIATSFTGNVPEFDLIVADESLRTLPVQVKTSRGHSWPTSANLWIDIDIDEAAGGQIDLGDREISNPDLIYVCVLLAEPDTSQRDRFFILTKSDLQAICARNYREWMSKHDWKRPKNIRSLDNRYYERDLEPFEGNWALFSERLSAGWTGWVQADAARPDGDGLSASNAVKSALVPW